MNLIDADPVTWLRAVLAEHPQIREATFDVPPHADRIVAITNDGVRLSISIRAVQSW